MPNSTPQSSEGNGPTCLSQRAQIEYPHYILNRMASSKDEKSTDLLSKDAQIDSLCNCQCIFSLYGNDYVKQREYTCPKCLSDGAICEYCYFNCHKNCSKTKKKSKVVNYLVCDCALVLKHHALPSSQEESNEEKSKDVLVTKEQKDNVIMDYILHPLKISRELRKVALLSETNHSVSSFTGFRLLASEQRRSRIQLQ